MECNVLRRRSLSWGCLRMSSIFILPPSCLAGRSCIQDDAQEFGVDFAKSVNSAIERIEWCLAAADHDNRAVEMRDDRLGIGRARHGGKVNEDEIEAILQVGKAEGDALGADPFTRRHILKRAD